MTIGFEEQLREWGPNPTHPAPSLDAAEDFCRRLARSHYENFPVVTWILPKDLRQHFCNIYAYCRWSDDLADEIRDKQTSLDLLAWWRQELESLYAGDQPTHPIFVALQPTIERFQIPITPFADLLIAFEQDQRVLEYETFPDLLEYCKHSANPVGRLVLYLCEETHPQAFQWSDCICTGLQLANFWQDVHRDYDMGRIYLPRDDYERFGIARRDFELRQSSPEFVELLDHQVQRARSFFLFGQRLPSILPGRLRVTVDLFSRGGLRILERIEAIQFRVWEQRPRVGKWDVIRMMGTSIAQYVRHPRRRSMHDLLPSEVSQ